MRMHALALAGLFVIIAAGLAYAATDDCPDGTKYFKCSVNPNYVGFRCGASGLVRDLTCQCETVPGYVTQGTGDDATCVQAKCDDGTKTGECTANKPKFCVGGSTYADNSTKCGCPSGMKPSSAGIVCEYDPCPDGTKDGVCSSKSVGKLCTQGQLVDKASQCPCSKDYTKKGEACLLLCSDGTEAGKCSATLPKECSETGYLLDNAAKCGCPSDQVADASGKRCVPAGLLGGIGGSDLLGGSAPAPSGNASGAGSAAGAGGLSCCCLPTALIGLAGGFVFFRKRE